MALIPREVDETGRPTERYAGALETLAERMLQERCVFFLGAGASVDFTRPSLPTGNELSQLLAKKYGLEWHEHIPLSMVAYYYEFLHDRESLNSFLQDHIGNAEIEPSATVQLLSELLKTLEGAGKKTLTITTNYDLQFEQAYRNTVGRDPGIVIYKGGWDHRDRGRQLYDGLGSEKPSEWIPSDRRKSWLFKLHGCISQPEGHNLVITDEDYVNFLANALSNDPSKRLPTYINGIIARSTILFVGYGLADYNFRVIFKTTVEEAEGRAAVSYAVQYRKTEPCYPETPFERVRWHALDEFWAKKSVRIVTAEAALFMKDLLDTVSRIALQRKAQASGGG
jgi:SIR2-like domain